jgi:hypothetical protein
MLCNNISIGCAYTELNNDIIGSEARQGNVTDVHLLTVTNHVS